LLANYSDIVPQVLAAQDFAGIGLALSIYPEVGPIAVLASPAPATLVIRQALHL